MKKILIILAVIISIIFGFFGIKNYIIKNNPTDYLKYSLYNTIKEKEYDFDYKLSAEVHEEYLQELFLNEESSRVIADMISKIDIIYNYKVTMKDSFKSLQNYSLNYNKNPLLESEIIIEEEYFGISLPNFYNKYFVINYNSLIKNYFESEDIYLDEIDFKKYLDILVEESQSIDIDEKLYISIIDEYLDKNLKFVENSVIDIQGEDVKVKNYSLEIKIDEYFKSLIDLAEVVKEDEELKKLIKYKTISIIDEMITSEDYKILGLELSELEFVKESMHDDINNGFDNFFNEFENSINSYEDEFMNLQEETYSYSIYIDNKDIIRKMATNYSMENVSINMEFQLNNLGKKVIIEDNSKDYIDILEYYNLNTSEFKNEEKLNTIAKEFINSTIDEVLESDGYDELFNDLRLLENETGIYIDEYLDLLKSNKEEVKNINIVEIIKESIGASDYNDEKSDYETQENINISLITDNPLSEFVYIVQENYYESNYEEFIYLTSDDSLENIFNIILDKTPSIIFIDSDIPEEEIQKYGYSNPEIQFVLLDRKIEYLGNNLVQINFKYNEEAFIAGVSSGLATEKNAVGFVGLNNEGIKEYESWFKKGVEYIDSNIYIESIYIEPDSMISVQEIDKLLEKNIDIIYNTDFKSQDILSYKAESSDYYIIDNFMSDLYFGKIASIVKDYDYVIYEEVEYLNAGVISSEIIDYSFDYGMMYFSSYNLDGNIDDRVYEVIDLIIDGTIIIE